MKATALQILKKLPKENCNKCGEKDCMTLAMKLSDKTKKPGDCPKLANKQKKSLITLLSASVAAIDAGAGKNHVTIGGEEVLYRHEYRFVNKTAIFIDIGDLMSKEEVDRRIDFAANFAVERIGEKLFVDGIALRCASDNVDKFRIFAKAVAERYGGPIILCSLKPEILEAGAEILKKRKPVLYSATNRTWKKILEISEKYDASFAVYSPDLEELTTLTKEISKKGFNRLLMDPGIDAKELSGALNALTILRKSAVTGRKESGYPTIGSTVREGIKKGAFDEAMLAAVLVNRYASAVIMHTIEPWAMLNILTLRQSLYSDPRIEPMVESKLYPVCEPNRDSPIFMTSNFALTYYSVLGDLEKAKIPSYILPIDTSGLAVTVSVAADILTANKVKEALERNKVAEKVDIKKIIIPGFAARLKDSIEETTGWTVIVGPQDSSQIPEFLKKLPC
jgi:acetyl-CoA decarbonylase/synthase, CODH/ACS complex subunit gamma